jgi:hypothetical protein
MIGTLTPPPSDGRAAVKRLVRYVTAPEKLANERGSLVMVRYRNILAEDPESAIEEMETTCAMNDRVRSPMMHMIVSWKEGETPNGETVGKVAEDILKALGMEENQAVIAVHRDTSNYHLHIVANRLIRSKVPYVHA